MRFTAATHRQRRHFVVTAATWTTDAAAPRSSSISKRLTRWASLNAHAQRRTSRSSRSKTRNKRLRGTSDPPVSRRCLSHPGALSRYQTPNSHSLHHMLTCCLEQTRPSSSSASKPGNRSSPPPPSCRPSSSSASSLSPSAASSSGGPTKFTTTLSTTPSASLKLRTTRSPNSPRASGVTTSEAMPATSRRRVGSSSMTRTGRSGSSVAAASTLTSRSS